MSYIVEELEKSVLKPDIATAKAYTSVVNWDKIYTLGKLKATRVVNCGINIRKVKTLPLPRSVMLTYYIKREEIKIEVTRLDKKYKKKYRFTAIASAPLYSENENEDNLEEWNYTYRTGYKDNYSSSAKVYSKTKHGAEVSALTDLLQKCRAPLTKQQKLKNRELRKKGKEEITRRVMTEVRVSNTFDFIMNDEDTSNWKEIRK